MNNVFILCFVLLYNIALHGQEYASIKGTLIGKETNEPIPFANVTLKDSASTIMKETISDFDGNFQLDSIYCYKRATPYIYITLVTQKL